MVVARPTLILAARLTTVSLDQETPAVINHKNISKPYMNPHKRKYT